MEQPVVEVIERSGRHTDIPRGEVGPASWTELTALLRRGEAATWLSVARAGGAGVHTRPVFAAWTGTGFVVCSNPRAVKTRCLEADPHVSLAMELPGLHVVVEGRAVRQRTPAELARASAAMLEVYDWPTQVVGEELDAPYAAPTSGGPPFQAWLIEPRRTYAFPTEDQVAPSRFIH